jgi:hypothetical protein
MPNTGIVATVAIVADQVVVPDGGRVLEPSSHHELLERPDGL